MKLLVGALVCLLLLVGCGGGSTTIKPETNLEVRVTQEVIDSPLPTLEAKIAEDVKAAVSAPVTAATSATPASPTTAANPTTTAANPTTTAANPTTAATLVPVIGSTPEIEPTSQVDLIEEKPDVVEVNSNDTEECENATGEMIQKCMDQANAMIDENPKLCETATGLMAYVCQNRTEKSESTTHESDGSGGSGSGARGGGSDEIANPCDKVAEAFRSQCEASIKSDPNSSFYDPNSAGQDFVQNFDPNNIPKVAKSNFTELDKFTRMTKLRSVVGHDYAFGTTEYDPDGLNCRSMKHYFVQMGVARENHLYGSTPHTFEWMSIKFFAPADGVIQNVVRTNNQYGEEAQFAIASTDHPGYLFDFYHVKLLPGLDTGSEVSAGQQIGSLGDEESWGEIAVQAQISGNEKILLSFLQVATDEVLEEYKSRGVNTPSDVIVTKEERDANPIGCDRNSEAGWFAGSGRGETVMVEPFVIWAFESNDNWFFFD